MILIQSFDFLIFLFYRARVNRLSPASESQESEKKALYERHHVSMDIISVHVFRTAFDASKLEEGYDLGNYSLTLSLFATVWLIILFKDYIWNLIALSTWLVDFIEKLLRDGVLWDNQKPPPGHNGKERDPKVKQEVIDVDDPNAFAPKVGKRAWFFFIDDPIIIEFFSRLFL